MEFTNSFAVQAPLSVVWDFMLDAQEVAPCVPGAQITDVVDDRHFKGTVKVKLGAVQMTYRGELEMEPDEGSRTITLRAKGTEMRGSGGASGTFTTRLVEGSEGLSQVEMQSRVDVTGRVAQFGRGIMQDVANRIIKEFAKCLEQKLQQRARVGESAEASAAPATEAEIIRESVPASPPAQETVPAIAATSTPPSASQATAPSTPQATAVKPQPAQAYNPPSELRLQNLIFDITRTRLAAALRKLATIIEPK